MDGPLYFQIKIALYMKHLIIIMELQYLIQCRTNFQDNRFYVYTRPKKKRIQYSLQNYNQLRIVDKRFIFERNQL